MAPGITGAGNGRPKPSPIVNHFGALVQKSALPVEVIVGDNFQNTSTYELDNYIQSGLPVPEIPVPRFIRPSGPTKSVPLISICYGRSGDKGDVANIGVIARHERYYPFLVEFLTAERVHEYFSHFVKGTTTRYLLPGIRALNFVLTNSLGGGGLSSLNIDRQGKSYAQNLLTIQVDLPLDFISNPAKL
jgi:hypothetical protein